MTRNRNQPNLAIGVGSAHGDDQLGWKVVDRLSSLLSPDQRNRPAGIHFAKSPIDILSFLSEAPSSGRGKLLIADACRGIGAPGTIRRWSWPHQELPKVRFSGSHDLDLNTALELGRRLKRLPAVVYVWGIELREAVPGASLSPGLDSAVAKVADQMAEELGRATDWAASRISKEIDRSDEIDGNLASSSSGPSDA